MLASITNLVGRIAGSRTAPKRGRPRKTKSTAVKAPAKDTAKNAPKNARKRAGRKQDARSSVAALHDAGRRFLGVVRGFAGLAKPKSGPKAGVRILPKAGLRPILPKAGLRPDVRMVDLMARVDAHERRRGRPPGARDKQPRKRRSQEQILVDLEAERRRLAKQRRTSDRAVAPDLSRSIEASKLRAGSKRRAATKAEGRNGKGAQIQDVKDMTAQEAKAPERYRLDAPALETGGQGRS